MTICCVPSCSAMVSFESVTKRGYPSIACWAPCLPLLRKHRLKMTLWMESAAHQTNAPPFNETIHHIRRAATGCDIIQLLNDVADTAVYCTGLSTGLWHQQHNDSYYSRRRDGSRQYLR